jgi:hypothetical protein
MAKSVRGGQRADLGSRSGRKQRSETFQSAKGSRVEPSHEHDQIKRDRAKKAKGTGVKKAGAKKTGEK